MDAYLKFMAAALVINLIPGPAMLFTIKSSIDRGLKTGLAAAIGVEIGVLIYVLLTAFGLTLLIQQQPALYQAIQIAGIGYLLYLAWLCWPKSAASSAVSEQASTGGHFLLKGALLNLTNPKIAIFFLSLLPQFISADAPVSSFLWYGLSFNCSGLVVNLLAAFFAIRLTEKIGQSVVFSYLSSALFGLIAVSSALHLSGLLA